MPYGSLGGRLIVLAGFDVFQFAVLKRERALRKADQKRHVGAVVHALQYADRALFHFAGRSEIEAAPRAHRFADFHATLHTTQNKVVRKAATPTCTIARACSRTSDRKSRGR